MRYDAGRRFRQFIAPGMQADDDEDAVRINIIRIELVAALGLINAAVEFIAAYFRPGTTIHVLAIVAMVVMVGCMATARIIQQQPGPLWLARVLTSVFIPVALVLSIIAGYLIGRIAPLPYGYSVVALAFAAIFMTPPRSFAIMIGMTYILYVVLTLNIAGHTMLEHSMAIFNTGLACVTATIIRFALYRVRQRDRRQQGIIAAQNNALEAANTDLATHNAELNELMAVAAHDLRSPLFGLRNLLELAGARHPDGSDMPRRILEEGSRSITGMLALIARLLEAHELDRMPDLAMSAGDLGHAVFAARRRIAGLAQSADIAIEIDMPESTVMAAFEPHAMDRVLDNLLSNAIRFSPAGSVVNILCEDDVDRVTLTITDTGIGIPADERLHLFGKFRRGSAQPLYGERGSGLGLFITRKLMEAMEGNISYWPAAGGGSSFILTLMPATRVCTGSADVSAVG